MSSNTIDLFDKTHISDLVPDVAFLVPEMDESIIQYFLRMVIIKFARETRILRRKIEITTYDNTCNYYLQFSDDYRLYRLKELKHNGCCLRLNNSCECCSGEFEHQHGKIVLCDNTCATDTLTAEVIVIPTRTSCELDSDVVDVWQDAIIEGFKAMIYGGNDERWKNLTESRIALREYKRLTEEARADAMISNTSPKIVRLTS